MTPEHKALVALLRHGAETLEEGPAGWPGAYKEAAAAIESLSAQGEAEAARIGDAVLDWMIKYDLLDGDREYHVADVLAVLDDLTPSERPAAPAPVPDAIGALIEKYALACKRNAHEMAGMPITVIMQHFREFAQEAALASNKPMGDGWTFKVHESDGRTWLTIQSPEGVSAVLSCKTSHDNGETIASQVLHSLAAYTGEAGR